MALAQVALWPLHAPHACIIPAAIMRMSGMFGVKLRYCTVYRAQLSPRRCAACWYAVCKSGASSSFFFYACASAGQITYAMSLYGDRNHRSAFPFPHLYLNFPKTKNSVALLLPISVILVPLPRHTAHASGYERRDSLAPED